MAEISGFNLTSRPLDPVVGLIKAVDKTCVKNELIGLLLIIRLTRPIGIEV